MDSLSATISTHYAQISAAHQSNPLRQALAAKLNQLVEEMQNEAVSWTDSGAWARRRLTGRHEIYFFVREHNTEVVARVHLVTIDDGTVRFGLESVTDRPAATTAIREALATWNRGQAEMEEDLHDKILRSLDDTERALETLAVYLANLGLRKGKPD